MTTRIHPVHRVFALLLLIPVVLPGCAAHRSVVGKWTAGNSSAGGAGTYTIEFRPGGTQTSTQHASMGPLSSHQIFQGSYTISGDQITIVDKTMSIGLDSSTQQAVDQRLRQMAPAAPSTALPSGTAANYTRVVHSPPNVFKFQVSGDTLTLTNATGGSAQQDLVLQRVN